MTLSNIFATYTGRQVNVIKTVAEHKSRHSSAPIEYTQILLDKNDPVVKALKADFAKAGVTKYRLLMPGDVVTKDYDVNRINVLIDDIFEGKFCIARFARG